LDTHGAQLRFTFDPPNRPDSDAPAVRAPLFVRHPRARRYVLRLLPDGTPRVTIPRRGSRREAERFLLAQQDWVDRQRASLEERGAKRPPRLWAEGHHVLLRGVLLTIRHGAGSQGDGVRVDADTLVVTTREGRGTGDLRAIVTGWLWRLARLELPARLHALGAQHGLEVKTVSVRSQRTRWGSCAPDGRVSLNWRLVQTPDPVRDYVLLHELMHLRQANHSKRFWRLVAAACPDYQAARHWLKAHERLLLDA
jgi:predicted metal-dependent hydrolase